MIKVILMISAQDGTDFSIKNNLDRLTFGATGECRRVPLLLDYCSPGGFISNRTLNQESIRQATVKIKKRNSIS